MQLTYNTQNLVGSGCYESRDSGLSDFGRDVIAEMNRLGILCDLSHVGAKTSEDAILASKQRVAYSHCLPAGSRPTRATRATSSCASSPSAAASSASPCSRRS